MARLSFVIGAAALILDFSAKPALAAPAPPDCGTRTFSVYFEEFKSDLTPEGLRALDQTQRSFRGCRIDHVRIVGLAGAKGTSDDNQALSEHRARAIADRLVTGGWSRDRLEMVAEGDKDAKVGDLDKPIRRRVRVTVQSRPRP